MIMTDEPTGHASRPAWGSRRAQFVFWLTALISLVLDLGTKWVAFRTLPPIPAGLRSGNPVQIIPGVLDFRLVWNEGAVFGLGAGLAWFFIAATVVAIGFIVHLFSRTRVGQTGLRILLGLTLGGALGNLYDRVFHGGRVRDFINITAKVRDISLWPAVFNVADAALVVGIGVLLLGWVLGWYDLDAKSARSAGEGKDSDDRPAELER